MDIGRSVDCKIMLCLCIWLAPHKAVFRAQVKARIRHTCVTLVKGRIMSLQWRRGVDPLQSRNLRSSFLSPKSRITSISVSVEIAMASWHTSPLEASKTDISIGMEAPDKVIFPVVEDMQDTWIEQLDHIRNSVSFFMVS